MPCCRSPLLEKKSCHVMSLLQPYIKESPYACKNSFEFVEKIKNTKLRPHEKLVSFDATALFPSVPIDDALKHILELLENDRTLQMRTKLSPYDIIDLADICLSTSNFLYDERHHTTEQSGPIGLSLMVTISVIWMDFTMKSAIKIAKSRRIATPRILFTYVDDCFATIIDPPPRPGLRSTTNNAQNQPANPASQFNDCLNAVHPRVQFTREEEEEKSLAFLDVLVTRDNDGNMQTEVYRKPSNTNVGLKPQSCQDPNTAISTFKGELCRCHRLCSTPEKTKEAINFVLNMFEDNGHDRQKLQQIAYNYSPPSLQESKGIKWSAVPLSCCTFSLVFMGGGRAAAPIGDEVL